MSRFSTFLPLYVRLVLALTRVKLFYPLAVCCLLGGVLFVGGVIASTGEQHHVRPADAFQQYQSAADAEPFEYLSLLDYVGKAMGGQLPRQSENMQVAGMAIIYAGSLFAIMLVLVARGAWRMQVRLSPVAGSKPKK